MPERYTIAFSIQNNLLIDTSPLMISAGNLLFDNQENETLVQLKLRNISNKIIRSVKVLIQPFDNEGRLIGDEVYYEYSNVNVLPDVQFGQKIPIRLPDNKTKSFSVSIIQVIFSDSTKWAAPPQTWTHYDPIMASRKIDNTALIVVAICVVLIVLFCAAKYYL